MRATCSTLIPNGDQGDAKIDWAPTQSDRVFARYSQQYVTNPTINSQALLYNSSGNNSFPLWNGVIDYVRTISPTLINEVRAGVNYYPAEGNTQVPGSANAGTLYPVSLRSFYPRFHSSARPWGPESLAPWMARRFSTRQPFRRKTRLP
jgi:hypothetical protein